MTVFAIVLVFACGLLSASRNTTERVEAATGAYPPRESAIDLRGLPDR